MEVLWDSDGGNGRIGGGDLMATGVFRAPGGMVAGRAGVFGSRSGWLAVRWRSAAFLIGAALGLGGGDSDLNLDPDPGPRWWRQRSSPDSGGGEADRELAFGVQDEVRDGRSGRIPAGGGNAVRSESGAVVLNPVLGRRSTGLTPARIAMAGLVWTEMLKGTGGVKDGGGMGRNEEIRAGGEMGLCGLGPYECLMEGFVFGLGMVLVGVKRPNKEKAEIRLQVQGTGAPALGE